MGPILLLIEQGADGERFDFRGDNGIGLKIENALKLFERHIQNCTDFGWQAL